MPIVYNKLFEKMKECGLTTYKIRKEKIIPESSMQRIRDGGDISTETISKLCEALHCQPGDLLEYVPSEKKAGRPLDDRP